jgi:putative transposase
MDKKYIKIKGVWDYFYRAVDKLGNMTDFILSEKSDKSAAHAFFIKAIGTTGLPEKVTMDKSSANNAELNTINLQFIIFALLGCALVQIHVRQIKYFNKLLNKTIVVSSK